MTLKEFIPICVLVAIPVSVVGLEIILCIVDRFMGTSYSCKFLGWHNGKGQILKTFDGCSLHSVCSKCGAEVMQDGQGNWF